jgi:hypothetical protein
MNPATESQVPVPYELLDEDDPVLAALGELVRSAVDGYGARASVAAYEPGTGLQPLTFSFTVPADQNPAKVKALVTAFRRERGVNLKPSVEDRVVYFTVPADVIGTHGRVSTYSNNECRGTLCRLAWARRADIQKQRRRQKLKDNFDAFPHGDTSTYKNYGCTCDACKAEWARFVAEYRQSKKSPPSMSRKTPATAKS